jgi:FixJ family two-component response regulator
MLEAQMAKGNVTMEQNLVPSGESHQHVKPVGEIYVVDDDKHMREILEATLVAQGFPVKTFEEGDAFLEATTKLVPICVFLDLVMPRRSGLQILRELRARRYWIPVFLTSAMDDVQTVVEAMKNGAQDYIAKPFDPSELLPRVRNAVDMWLHRMEISDASDIWASENREWFRLTPSEKDMLLLMRLMDTKTGIVPHSFLEIPSTPK